MESKIICQICNSVPACVKYNTEEYDMNLCNECFNTSSHLGTDSQIPITRYSDEEIDAVISELNSHRETLMQKKQQMKVFEDRVKDVIDAAYSQYFAMIEHAKESLESLNDNRDLETINDPVEREKLEGVNPEDIFNTLAFYCKRMEENKDIVLEVIQNAVNPKPKVSEKQAELLKLEEEKLQLELMLKDNQISELEQKLKHYEETQRMQQEWLEHLQAIQNIAESEDLKKEIYEMVSQEIEKEDE
jgi:hypothetical protein